MARKILVSPEKKAVRSWWWAITLLAAFPAFGFLSLALVSPPLYAAGNKPAGKSVPLEMTLKDGRLTAQVISAPLRQIMEELSRLSGIKVLWMEQEGEEPVSVEVNDLPLAEALERILKKNFMLTYASAGEEKRVKEIWILARGEGRSSPPPVAQVKATPVVELAQIQTPEPQFGEGAPPPGDERKAVTLETIINIAEHAPNPASRLETIKVLAAVAEEPRVKVVLSQMAESDSDPEVREAAYRVLAGIN